MRRATLMVLLLIGLVLMSTSSAMACGFPWGRCFVPYYSCGPCYVSCCPVTCYSYCYCAPVCCRPVCCQPACCAPASSQPAVDAPKAVPVESKKQPTPTLAPPEPVKEENAAPSLPLLETKTSQPTKPVEKKTAPKSPSKIMLPSELSLPMPSSNAPKAAEGNQDPSKTPAPAAPKARPVDRPMSAPSEKPLVAEVSYDNPFILETDQLQIWTDSTGNFRIEARFVSFDEKTVRLQRSNGQYIRVAYDRLSMADRSRVRDLSLALAMKTSMK